MELLRPYRVKLVQAADDSETRASLKLKVTDQIQSSSNWPISSLEILRAPTATKILKDLHCFSHQIIDHRCFSIFTLCDFPRKCFFFVCVCVCVCVQKNLLITLAVVDFYWTSCRAEELTNVETFNPDLRLNSRAETGSS